jgi:hypothetical protein
MDVDEGPASANLATPFISGPNDCYFRWVSKADSVLKLSSHVSAQADVTVAPRTPQFFALLEHCADHEAKRTPGHASYSAVSCAE